MVLQGPYVRQTLPLDQQDSVRGEIIAISDINVGTQEKTVPPRTARAARYLARRQDCLATEFFRLGQRGIQVFNLDIQRNAVPAVLTGPHATVNACCTASIDHAILHRVVTIDLPAK